ncbi:MAG: WxcM-like domain-containing protein [Bacteroidales bacterium]|jgi:dTDP-4-dehydrorhamnose 3,5-epimerase-like enzyme|nr:WxcM-like domain-containing protein [Bacteroidales bacterium]MZP53884.1 WxcM-like domain-containing protein [Bacteroidales bacterium]HPY66813.1 FdtA/QdtA family cupin domain-containing protein [Bacteroidales bacterium]HQB35959.1 FdtA/QdtA family cupin domain-containing protein [Bacteroidales bacterium]
MDSIASDIFSCNVVELNKIHNPAGNITIVQNDHDLPFNVRRIYYLYDVPSGSDRGGHAHKNLYQLVIAVSGSFDVILDDGSKKKIVQLNRPNYGLLVVPGIWRELVNFSSGAICLVLASQKYTEDDYIRDYSKFREMKNLNNVD